MEKLWKYKKIGEVCIVERGASPRPIDKYITDNESGINWIKIGDTSDSMYITETAQKIIVEGMKKSRYVKPGDFLLSNSMSFGRPYILKIDGCIHDGWLVLRDENALFDKRFLYYYLSSKTTYKKLKSMAVGGVVNNLNSEMVRNVIVPVPDKEEQSEIADLFDKIKKILEENKCYLKEWLKDHPHLSCVIPKYGTVCFLKYDYKIDSNTFCEKLQEETGVFFVPGCCFDVENHLRFGLANDSQIVKEGLEVFSNWLKKLDTSR